MMRSTLGSRCAVVGAIAWFLGTTPALAKTTVIVVAGAPGEPVYQSNLVRQAQLWTQTCERSLTHAIRIGDDPTSSEPNDRERLKQVLAAEPLATDDPLWLVLAGHGTFDGKDARFNLRGPDLTATDLADWLRPFRRQLVVIDAASASAPFLTKLAATNRVLLTATRSGHEQNYARLGEYLAETIAAPESDLDKDGQTSLLEAFLAAAHKVAEFYKTEGRLATEHALLDDNGDGLGTPAEWFRGVRAFRKPQNGASVDGARAHQIHLVPSLQEQSLTVVARAQRDTLEMAIALLRNSKGQIPEEDYYRRLETLLIELARLYQTR